MLFVTIDKVFTAPYLFFLFKSYPYLYLVIS